MLRAAFDVLVKGLRDRAGNVAIATALSLPVILGAFGIGAEAASWISTKRALQNAADAAAIAAATNGGATYGVEAKAVAAQYGFQDGAGGVTVTASDTAPCPTGSTATSCYSVTVSRVTPVLLAQIVGFAGDATLNGGPAKIVTATAVAVQGSTKRPYCLLALGASGSPAIRTNGAPNADLSGCNLMSDNGATCNGHNLKADIGDSVGTNNGCGVVQHSNMKALQDPYAGLADNIPPDPCNGAYPQAPAKKNDPALPASNTPAGAVTWSGTVAICGDLQLANDVTISQNTTLVIYNGSLDTNGYTLQTAANVGATVVFAGSNGGGYGHIPTGGGTIDIAAPTSGPWSGMALYQAPGLTSGVDISEAGNDPTWDVTGVAYFPHSSVTFSGAVNKASNGKSCFGLVVDNLTVNGTADILAHGQCDQAGVILPSAQVAGRGMLVQ